MMRMTPAKGSEIGAVRVNLTDKNSGRRSSIEIARELRTALRSVSDAYPGSTIQVVEDPPGPPLRGTIYAEIYANDPEELRWLADRTQKEFRKTYDVVEVTNTQKADQTEWRLSIDREKAAAAGVLPAAAAFELKILRRAASSAGRMRTVNVRRSPFVLKSRTLRSSIRLCSRASPLPALLVCVCRSRPSSRSKKQQLQDALKRRTAFVWRRWAAKWARRHRPMPCWI